MCIVHRPPISKVDKQLDEGEIEAYELGRVFSIYTFCVKEQVWKENMDIDPFSKRALMLETIKNEIVGFG